MSYDAWVEKLEYIYQDRKIAEETAASIEKIAEKHVRRAVKSSLDQKDVMLITYGDSIVSEGEKPLETLDRFLSSYVKDLIPTVHILPFFPYSSDDGFSVIDYQDVNPELGTWEDISRISSSYSLMIDAVANHISRRSRWFEGYLAGEAKYRDFFISCDPEKDYSKVTRPRTVPLLTAFDTKEGRKYLWTTFSDDQIDLNYHCPDVLVSVIDAILLYAEKGARFIRLDAIGFIWKEDDTTCFHLKRTHEIVKLIRLVLEDYAPGVSLITETNVPQKDNISYFGNGHDEAVMVYQFPLPPLVMHTMLSGNASKLTSWIADLYNPGGDATYFNFLSSHDGIGIRPAEGILSEDEQKALVRSTLENGGRVSYKSNGDGTESPYELNINYMDAITRPYEPDHIRNSKMKAALAILLSLQGVPGIYIHSLLGSRNDYYGMTTSGIPRRINREKLEYAKLEAELKKDSLRSDIFNAVMHLLDIRRVHEAFSPSSAQEAVDLDGRIVALERKGKNETIFCLINVSGESFHIDSERAMGTDLITGIEIDKSIDMKPYQVMWIRK